MSSHRRVRRSPRFVSSDSIHPAQIVVQSAPRARPRTRRSLSEAQELVVEGWDQSSDTDGAVTVGESASQFIVPDDDSDASETDREYVPEVAVTVTYARRSRPHRRSLERVHSLTVPESGSSGGGGAGAGTFPSDDEAFIEAAIRGRRYRSHFYFGDTHIDSDSDGDHVVIGEDFYDDDDDDLEPALHGDNTGRPPFVPEDIVPAQKERPVGVPGQWLLVREGWRLVAGLSEHELLSVQMQLGGLERKPSPPPSPPPVAAAAATAADTAAEADPRPDTNDAPTKRSRTTASASAGATICIVCDEPADTVFTSCGHVRFCVEHAKEHQRINGFRVLERHRILGLVVACPECRTEGQWVKLFF